MAAEGFHEGELAVQSRAGVRAQAARLGGTMLAVPDLNGGISGFLAERDFAVLTARDADGRLWTSALIASAGFLEARDRELTVHAAPGSGDALHGLAEGQAVGLLAIEFATRRRVRVNGTLTYAGTDELQTKHLATAPSTFSNGASCTPSPASLRPRGWCVAQRSATKTSR